MKYRTLVLALWAVLLAMPALAQEQSGSIQGTVKDSTGAVLPGATVEAKTATGVVSTAISDSQGIYRFPALQPGTYTVSATLQGFSPAKVDNAVLSLGQLLTINHTLALGAVTETVQVAAESPLIDVKQNATFAVVSKDVIDRIPKGRDFTTVIAMAPGANSENRAGGISIGGASGSENRYIVDGIDTTNLQTGASGKTFVFDFLDEVQVKTSGYNAEFPGATGGVVNAITKSGNNRFHGAAGTYYTNNDSLKGANRPTLRLVPTNTTQAEFIKTPLDEVPEWQPVFEVGGPIRADRLWFYAGYAPVRSSTSRTVTFRTPPTTGPATQTFKRDEPFDRLILNGTWQVSKAVRAKFSYAPQTSRVRGSLPANIEPDGTSTSNANTDYASSGRNDWNDSYSGVVDWLVRPNWYLNLSGGYFMTDTETLGNGTAIQHSMNGNISVFPNVPANLVQPNGYVDNKSSSKTTRDKLARTYFNAANTWFLNKKGQHAIKAGARFERVANDRLAGQIEPTITFNWNQTFVNSTGVESRGTYGYYMVTNNVLSTGKIHSDNWGLFVQDGWSPTGRLTINAGVRAESERVPFYTPGQENNGIKFGFGDKIAPRIGFAYDVKGDGRWKAYGSFGRFFDIMKLELPRGSLGGEQWHQYTWTLDTLDWPNVNCQEGTSGCPGRLLDVTTLRFGSNEANNPETIDVTTKYFGAPRNMIQDDIKPTQSQEFTVGLDHELSSQTSVGVRYVHNWVTRAIEDFGWNEGGTEFYFIGNPGFGSIGQLDFLWGPGKLYQPINGKTYPQVKPKREYDAVELSLRKRYANRWYGSAVYTWSRLFGNYPGLASSDEASTTTGNARLSPNVNRLYDGPWLMYDAHGNQVFGRLNTDRPNYLKLQGTYDMPWGTVVGVNWYARSGALFSKGITYQGYGSVWYDGRGSMGRTPIEQATDVYLQHDIKLGGNRKLNLNINVANLFDNDVATSIYTTQYRDSFLLTPVESFFSGFDPVAIAAANSRIRPDPRFGLRNLFLGRRDIRLGVRFSF
jgi:Carboxypeptidase regulatory-like domain/TonB dependent receptor